MKAILQAKHWQLFLLFVIPQLLAEMFSVSSDKVLQLLTTAIFLAWLWAVGVTLNFDNKDRNILFKTCFFYSFLYSPYSIYFGTNYNVSEIGMELLKKEWPNLFFHVIYIITLLCCVFFCAKRLKKYMLKRSVVFSDYILDIILILLFPIGVWFLQPRVNKLSELTEPN
jgi:hypothetical protein